MKVGITRASQIPVRWIDQGAVQALAILKVSKRYHAGLVEVAFKTFLNDKTNWRAMLKNEYETQDLYAIFERLWPRVESQLNNELLGDVTVIADPSKVQSFEYPALEFPLKVTSYNLEKTPEITDRLTAVKGQYLIFTHGVINIRKFAGYQVEIEVLESHI